MNFQALSESYRDEYLKKVIQILKIPSVYEKSESFPFGEGIDQALNTMLAIGEKDGFLTKNVDGQAGHIEYGSGEELLGILGHLDVVPPGSGWSTDPFEPVIKEGKLYARGAQDDKGPVMAAYMAMKLLKDQGFEPRKRVRLIVGTDEERDWQGIDHYFAREEMPALGFTPDASFPVIHAEKGLLDGYLNFPPVPVEESPVSIQKLTAGDRLNMVPDEAKVWLKTDMNLEDSFYTYVKDRGVEGHIEQVGDTYAIVCHGVSVHASTPEFGRNAITTLIGYLTTLPLEEGIRNRLQALEHAFSETDGSGVGIQQRDQESGALTLNLGSLQLDTDGSMKVGFNLRYPVTADFQGIETTWKTFAAEWDGEYEVYDHLKALYIEKDHPFIQTLLEVYNESTGEQESAKSMGGATYARSLKAGVAYGALFKHSPDTAHQKDEHVYVKDMIKAIEIYAKAIYELTK
ncbi:dipeptidase PepV [Halobacillus fulvus]|nr:dipeptidase PepV [Halobacillus fulvus]